VKLPGDKIMAKALLKNNRLVTDGYGQPHYKPTFGQPGIYLVSYAQPARVGYEFKRGTVRVTQADLDNQPVELEIE
jgi:hypothetical protein